MSRPVPQRISCPVCNHEDSVTVWDSLDAQANPAEKEQLINGTLFQYVCPECGATTTLNYPCLYVDPERAIRVYYVPDTTAVPEVMSMLEGIASQRAASPDNERDERMRIATTLNELREKATIFDDDLDDRVVEILKHLFIEFIGEQPGFVDKQIDAVFYTGLDNENNIMFYVQCDMPQIATAPMPLYEELENQILFDELSVGNEFIIDDAWANAILIKQQFAQEAEEAGNL